MQWGLPWPGVGVAVEAEDAGCAAFCTGEFSDTNAYMTCAEMALSTTKSKVGPGIAYGFARSPFVHASAARQLHRMAPGRAFLGLGAGTHRMNTDWFGVDAAQPAARMAELVGAIKAFLHAENGERIAYSGEYYAIDANIAAPVHGAVDVPILLGAFNKIMLRTAGQVADGVLGHGLFTDRWWQEVVSIELSKGAKCVNRSAEDLARWGWLITAVNDRDPERATRDARLQIAFYLTVRTYDALVDLHGWHDQVAAIRRAFRGDRPDTIAQLVTDDMLWSIAACGTREQAAEMINRRAHLPDLAFLAAPSFLVGPRRRTEYARAAVGLAAAGI